jgi:hypothetical protein
VSAVTGLREGEYRNHVEWGTNEKSTSPFVRFQLMTKDFPLVLDCEFSEEKNAFKLLESSLLSERDPLYREKEQAVLRSIHDLQSRRLSREALLHHSWTRGNSNGGQKWSVKFPGDSRQSTATHSRSVGPKRQLSKSLRSSESSLSKQRNRPLGYFLGCIEETTQPKEFDRWVRHRPLNKEKLFD